MRNYLSISVILFLLFFHSFSQDLTLNVIDTDFSKGRLVNEQIISVDDVSKMHGHMCDGLVLGFIGLRQSLYQLFPDSIIDRTNVRIISKSSPCITDIAIYLSGGRYQFNTFYVNDSIPYLYVVQRIDNRKTFGVLVQNGVVPSEIRTMGSLAIKGELEPCQLEELRILEDAFILKLVNSIPQEIFTIVEIQGFDWNSPLAHTFLKTDVLNKNQTECH